MPTNITTCVGRANYRTGRYYLLLKDENQLVVEAPPCYLENPTQLDRCYHEFLNAEYNFGLEIIQTLLDVLEFTSNWAYLIRQDDGSYRFVYKNKSIHRISCTTLAPCVEESEIRITKWVSAEERYGIWKDREVDLLMAWDNISGQRVERSYRGHRAIQGLDVSFLVLGHVIRDGEVVGIMTEPAHGRMIEVGDRALVYEAVSKLQRNGVLYKSNQHTPFIMISEGKVRFLDIESMTPLPQAELMQQAEHWWTLLHESFRELEAGPNIYTPRRYLRQCATILSTVPSPHRPIGSTCILVTFELLYRDVHRARLRDKLVRRKSSHHARLTRRSVCLAPVASSGKLRPEGDEKDDTLDAPLDGVHVRRHDRSVALRNMLHPFHCASLTKPILPWGEGSDTTSIGSLDC